VKYDSLQANVTRRMSGGFQLTGSYTYAKARIVGRDDCHPAVLD